MVDRIRGGFIYLFILFVFINKEMREELAKYREVTVDIPLTIP